MSALITSNDLNDTAVAASGDTGQQHNSDSVVLVSNSEHLPVDANDAGNDDHVTHIEVCLEVFGKEIREQHAGIYVHDLPSLVEKVFCCSRGSVKVS